MSKYYACPRITNEFMDCSLPLTADTTSQCTFKCIYCFAAYQKINNPSIVNKAVKPLNVKYFEKIIKGKYPNNPYYKNFIKNRFPLHFGGLSDCFDNYEKQNKVTLKVLKILADANYPCVISTKGTLFAYGEYYDILKNVKKNKNFVFQFSIITNNEEKAKLLEEGCPTVTERIKAMQKISNLGYWTILRLRPFIVGVSDDGLNTLFKKVHLAGAKALSTEFFCYEVKMNKQIYKKMTNIVGFNINNYYQKLSPKERGGYRRLNRNVKEKYVKQMWLLCKKYKLQFNCSDPDFKELNQSGSCCGLPATKQIYNSDCVNYSRGQLTYFVKEMLQAYIKGKKNQTLTLNQVLKKVPYNWMQEKGYWGDSLKSWGGNVQNKNMNHKYLFTQLWNNLRSAGNPYNYFCGLLKPIGLDKNKNIIYKFNPPSYIKQWAKEGIL